MWLCCQDWIFLLEKGRSISYSAAEAADHCLCSYCRNFYETVDVQYPNLRTLLGDFGINLEAPDMMIPLEPATDCILFYSVAGQIVQPHKNAITVDGLKIMPQTEYPGGTSMEEPCFFLRIDGIRLPWSLPESMDGVTSSANSPDFLHQAMEALQSNTLSNKL